jgi:type I restriction enzyme, S subunit
MKAANNNTCTEQNRGVPKLRFPEFEGKWGKVKLRNVSTYFNGGSFENDVQEEGKYELVTLKSINVSGNLVHSKRFIDIEVPTLSKDTLVMILSEQAPGLLGMTALIPIDNKYVLNQRVAEIRPKDDVERYFLSMAINRNQRYFSKHGAGTKVQNISKPNVENYQFLCPTLPEQQKIASFLSSIDTKIEQLTKKKMLLEQYKKGLMQQIFSQQLRFIPALSEAVGKEDGTDYPDWGKMKLGEIGITINGLIGKTKENFGKGKPYVQYKQIFDNSKIDISKCDFVDILENEKQTKVQYGDVFFTTSSETPKEIATSSVLLDHVDEMYLNSFCFGYRVKKETLNPLFARFLFRSETFRKKMTPLAQGSTRYNISKSSFLKLIVQLPNVKEQTQIANFLSAIDTKIELVNTQLQNTQQFKKGLLQQMFV